MSVQFRVVVGCVFLLCSLAMSTRLANAMQEESESPPELTDDELSSLSIFSAMVANGEAWNTGDCLVQIVTTYDALTEKNGVPSGLMRRAERLNRVAFDLEKRRFLRIHLGKTEVTNYESDPPDSAHNSRWRGDCLDQTSRRYWTNAEGSQLKSSDATNPSTYLHHFPDYRFFPLQNGTMNNDMAAAALSFVEQLKRRKSSVVTTNLPNHRIRLKMMELSPDLKIVADPTIAEADSSPRSPKMITEWTFDQERLLPTSSQTMLQLGSSPPQTVVKKTYRWQNINDVFVPIFMQATAFNRQQRTLDGKTFLGNEITEYSFHWFSLNKPLAEHYFDGSMFRDEQTVLSHVLPERCRANSLLKDTKSPSLSPPQPKDD